MACFTCGENKDLDTISLLMMYKKASEKTGIMYWFFKNINDGEIKIMNNEDFKKFKAANKQDFLEKKYEYSRIDEFRVT